MEAITRTHEVTAEITFRHAPGVKMFLRRSHSTFRNCGAGIVQGLTGEVFWGNTLAGLKVRPHPYATANKHSKCCHRLKTCIGVYMLEYYPVTPPQLTTFRTSAFNSGEACVSGNCPPFAALSALVLGGYIVFYTHFCTSARRESQTAL